MHLKNNYKQFQNVQITNLKALNSTYKYKSKSFLYMSYDDRTKQYITKIIL